jgi:hypothetical protein
MSKELIGSYALLTTILPKVISDQIFVVYTNCHESSVMSFDHLSIENTETPQKLIKDWSCRKLESRKTQIAFITV